MQNLKIGIAIDDLNKNLHFARFTDWVSQQDGLTISVVIITQIGTGTVKPVEADRERSSYLRQSASDQALRLILWSEGFLLKFYSKEKRRLCEDHLNSAAQEARADVEAKLPAPIIRWGATDQLEFDQSGKTEQLDLDLLVNLNPTPLPRSLTRLARLGAIRIGYSQGRSAESATAGFWESYYRTPKTKFSIISQPVEKSDEEIILEGSFRTQFSFLLNQAHLYRKSLAQFEQVILTIAGTGMLPRPRARPVRDGLHLAQPDLYVASAYLTKLASRISAKAFRRIMNVKEKWGIQVIHGAWQEASLFRAKRISAPPGRFWADPFLYSHGGRTYCFIEDYVYSANRAHISVLDLSGDKCEFLGIALKEDFHLSFPFIFEYRGQTYMCPESSESNQIRIYRSKLFPFQWELCSIAMDNVSAADSMFFEHGGKWWLLTSFDRSGLNDHCSELCLFYADSPLARSWIPHPKNPLYVDTDGGRNAGLILENRTILRAAQNQGFDQYGESLSLYEIVKLDEENYEEMRIMDFRQVRANSSLGSHHISTTGKITAIDFLTRKFAP